MFYQTSNFTPIHLFCFDKAVKVIIFVPSKFIKQPIFLSNNYDEF
jgi:hypothetical protein